MNRKMESRTKEKKGGRRKPPNTEARATNGGKSGGSTAPAYKGLAATVQEPIPAAVDGATPFYVTAIKSKHSPKPSSPAVPAKNGKSGNPASKAAATVTKSVAAAHAKAAKDLHFDSTTLGVLDPSYATRLFKEGFISSAGWDHLRTGYRYTGVDHSFCGNRFLYLWWNLVVERFVPMWVAYVLHRPWDRHRAPADGFQFSLQTELADTAGVLL